MVHYIRFLRTPQVAEVPKKGFAVSGVITVTTDLGDALFGGNVELLIRIVDATRSGEIIATQTVSWYDGSRAVKLNVPCGAKYMSRLVRVHITTVETISTLASCRVPTILDVWSESLPLKHNSSTEAMVERILTLSEKRTVRQWEQTGDSIARHIWDASLGFIALFQQIFSESSDTYLPTIKGQLREAITTHLKVLEVGAGCGIVGIALAQLRKSHVLLTDLEDAQDILQSNVDVASLASGSTLRRQVLGWGPSIDMLAEPRFDLVLVSDCIYNPDSSLLLVETLVQVSHHNADVLILVGFKRRHDADDIFFDRMRSAGFAVVETCEILLPHTMTDYDAAEPKVEMFVFKVSAAS